MTNPDLAALSEAATCPFCGHSNIVSMIAFKEQPGHVMMCGKCAAKSGKRPSKAEAIAAWNHRAGRLVQIDEGMRERVAARLLAEQFSDGDPLIADQGFCSRKTIASGLADAAIAEMMGGAK